MEFLRAQAMKTRPSLQIRAISFDEVPDLLRVVRRAVEHGCRDHYDAPQRNAVYASYAQTLFVDTLGPFETVVAEEHGRVVAFAQLDLSDDRLRALFVDAGHQQRGIGLALLDDLENRATASGSTRLHGAMSLNAISFYLRAGFRPCHGPERLQSARISIPVQRMEKDLRKTTTVECGL